MTESEPDTTSLRPAVPFWAAALPPLVAGYAMFSLAGVERDLQAAAESRYLALAATTVLLAAAGVARRPLGPATLALHLLSVVAFVAIPAGGPARGAALGALLSAGAAALLLDNLLARRAELFEPPGSLGPARLVQPAVLVGAGLVGLNLLQRQAELLEASTLRLLFVLAALPVATAVIVIVLFARLGTPALAGTAALVLAAGGVRSNVALVLAAALCADGVARAVRHRWPGHLAAAGAGLAVVLGAVLVREPAFGLLLAAMAAGVVWRRFAFAIALVAAGALTWWQPAGAGTPWPSVLAGVPLVLIAAPSLIGRGNLQTVAAALLLVLGGLRFLPPQQALLAGIGLWIVLYATREDGLPADDPPPTGPWHGLSLRAEAAVFGYGLQGGLLFFATLSATYPWLRPAHLENRLAGFGVDTAADNWWTLAGIVVVAHGTVWLGRLTRVPPPLVVALAAVLLTSTALSSWGALGPRQTLLEAPRQVLTADSPAWTADTGGCGILLLDTAVANSGGIEPGQAVARVGPAGFSDTAGAAGAAASGVHVLRHGEDTGEWSARGSGAVAGSQPWIHWVAAGEDRPFFGSRYRTEIDLAESCGAGNGPITVVRDPDLPPEAELTLFFALHLGRPGS